MIYRISSSLDTFKNLEFRSRFNILVAKKTQKSSDLHTRNRAGKTSFIKIIHFLFGAQVEKNSLFKADLLKEQSFNIDFDLTPKNRLTVERSCKQPSKISILSGDYNDWSIKPTTNKKALYPFISNSAWRAILGQKIFDLNVTDKGGPAEKNGPTFRMLFPYLVRRQEEGGFMSAIQNRAGQYLYENQVSISYLLNLDWEISKEYQDIRDKESSIKTIQKPENQKIIGNVIGKVADLRTHLTVQEDRYLKMKEDLSKFNVLPQYRELEQEASEITRYIGNLSDQNTVDRQIISNIQESLLTEKRPEFVQIEELYKEAKIIFPELVSKRFEEVKDFHSSVLRNRALYFEAERSDAEKRLEKREKEMVKKEFRRKEIMDILKSHNALDQRDKFQSELIKLETEVNLIRERFKAAQMIEKQKDQLEDERRRLKRRLQQDIEERVTILKKAILYFEEASRALYREGGSFVCGETDNGPTFQVNIHGQSSKGITNMSIFAFDMMLMRICVDRKIGPGFLVHDSHLFDGVDERQVALALQYGAKIAEEFGFQYIVTMNEDDIPTKLFDQSFNIDKYILDPVLTDLDDGGLFGQRFEIS